MTAAVLVLTPTSAFAIFGFYESSTVGIRVGYDISLSAEVTLKLCDGHQCADFGLGYWDIYNWGIENNIFYTLQTDGNPVNLYFGAGVALLHYFDGQRLGDTYYNEWGFDVGIGMHIGTELIMPENIVLGLYLRGMAYFDMARLTGGISVGYKW